VLASARKPLTDDRARAVLFGAPTTPKT
jgi:hypothetical protein